MTIDPAKVGHVVFAFIIAINIINTTSLLQVYYGNQRTLSDRTHSDPAKDLNVVTFELTKDHVLQARML